MITLDWYLKFHLIGVLLLIGFEFSVGSEGEKNHKKGGLNCVFENFFFHVLKNCSQVQSLK